MEFLEEDLSRLVNKGYLRQGFQNIKSRQNLLQTLIKHKKLPKTGWSEAHIEHLLSELAALDSNNFAGNVGVGEREGRVFSPLVSRRHFNLSHGIGRSGDIAEVQPKAAGSSLIYKLTTCLTLHALKISGLTFSMECLVMPMATGMSLALCMMALKAAREKENKGKSGRTSCKYVIWPRIDQKSCFKSMITAGLIPLVVENVMDSVTGELTTDIDAIRQLLETHRSRVDGSKDGERGDYQSDILCVMSTTSCFAPRQPDRVDSIAQLCKEFNVAHVINNAYGLQCDVIAKKINRAVVVGRVDAGK